VPSEGTPFAARGLLLSLGVCRGFWEAPNAGDAFSLRLSFAGVGAYLRKAFRVACQCWTGTARDPAAAAGWGATTPPNTGGSTVVLGVLAYRSRVVPLPTPALLGVRLCKGRARRPEAGYLVDSASSHMLVSKIKPCMSKFKQSYCETANGSLNQLSFI
jgi:hypothetical protein